MENRFIQYGNTRIDYQLIYANRKKLVITVHADLQVVVEVPKNSTVTQIEEKVHKRAAWILKQQQDLSRYNYEIPPREYVSGESHRYLGQQYQLKIQTVQTRENVEQTRERILVKTKQPENKDHKAALLEKWYRQQAKRIFAESISQWFPRFERYAIEYPEFTVRKMKTHWGSCSPSGRITLNLKLIQYPKYLIDYIVVHELAHLVEHNHSPAYYQLLSRIMPDWRQRKDTLASED